MLRSLYLLNDEANLAMYLKGRIRWILHNDSINACNAYYMRGIPINVCGIRCWIIVIVVISWLPSNTRGIRFWIVVIGVISI